ncbi:MAG: hypothetical protein VXB09_09940 [Gammaproteobacteria bacterium]
MHPLVTILLCGIACLTSPVVLGDQSREAHNPKNSLVLTSQQPGPRVQATGGQLTFFVHADQEIDASQRLWIRIDGKPLQRVMPGRVVLQDVPRGQHRFDLALTDRNESTIISGSAPLFLDVRRYLPQRAQ